MELFNALVDLTKACAFVIALSSAQILTGLFIGMFPFAVFGATGFAMLKIISFICA